LTSSFWFREETIWDLHARLHRILIHALFRVTVADRATFLHINTLACLTGTTLGVVSVKKCPDLGFKAEICIIEVKINPTKPTLIE